MSLYIDGKKAAERSFTGFIANKPYPVSIGYNAENDGQEYSQNMSNARFDRVAVFDKAIGIERLTNGADSRLKSESQLWLDFETEDIKGEYFSLGIGGRSYGLVWPDRKPQPELWQVKKSAQPVQVAWSNRDTKEVEITNHYSFTDLKELKCIWQLTANNSVLQEGELGLSLKPGEKIKVSVPFTQPEIKSGVNYNLLLSFQTREDKVWAKQGFEIAFEQLELPWHQSEEVEVKVLLTTTLKDTDGKIVISGKDFIYEFNKVTGELVSMKFHGEDLISSGPTLNIWRAPLANETDSWATGASSATRDGIGTCKQLVQSGIELSNHQVRSH
jgi:beta-galactosidase